MFGKIVQTFGDMWHRLDSNLPEFNRKMYAILGPGIMGYYPELEPQQSPVDKHIHATGNLILSSDQHVIIRSGKGKENHPAGETDKNWGIHLNPELDEYGWPISYEDAVDEIILADVDEYLHLENHNGGNKSRSTGESSI